MCDSLDQALANRLRGPAGKISVTPTKPLLTPRNLILTNCSTRRTGHANLGLRRTDR
jgi:hypothetical protein